MGISLPAIFFGVVSEDTEDEPRIEEEVQSMTGIHGIIETAAEVALGVATPKTMLQLRAPTTKALYIKEWSISFDGVLNTEHPITIQMKRCDPDGAGTANNPIGQGTETPTATGLRTFTGEPTMGDLVDQCHVHPQGGRLIRQFPQSNYIHVPAGEAICIIGNSPTGTHNGLVGMRFVELH